MSNLRVRKATGLESQQWRSQPDALYPLHGFVKLNGYDLPVEYVGEGKGQPNYEVHAPNKTHFRHAGTHTILATTLRDLTDQLAGEFLVKCNAACEGPE